MVSIFVATPIMGGEQRIIEAEYREKRQGVWEKVPKPEKDLGPADGSAQSVIILWMYKYI